MVKSLLKAGLLMAALAGSALAAQETYVVGAGGTYRPFEFENSQKQLEGFDIDIIKAIAKAENFNVKLVNTPWEGIFATLGSGDRDIIISGITITAVYAGRLDDHQMHHNLRDPRHAVGLNARAGAHGARGARAVEICAALPGAVPGALLCQRVSRHAAVCTDNGGALRAGAALY
ncbi:hypothetical protein CSK29544_01809 [Cronobacter sakazakii]|nr:hypothetical protein CSK29544_01809 [Cronobacter sakazakii]